MTEIDDLIKTLEVFGFREINKDERRTLSRENYNYVIELYNGVFWRFFIK